jgi:hypothetical protein
VVAPTPAELAAAEQEARQEAASRNQGDSHAGNGARSNQTTTGAGNQTTSQTQPRTVQPTDGTAADSALDSLLPPPVEPSDPSSAPSSSHSLLSGAGVMLFGLLALALVILGIAAVPRRSGATSGFTAVVGHHRLEISLIGTAVLACALIGLVIALLSP